MNADEMIELCKKLHTPVCRKRCPPFPLSARKACSCTNPVGNVITICSQLMSVNIGHHHPKVREAMKDQVDKLLYVFPEPPPKYGHGFPKSWRAWSRASINTFFYTLGGAEANENALKAARYYTGRHKILQSLPLIPRRHERLYAAHRRSTTHS